MGKQCKIYYATVVDDGGYSWARNGSCQMEPIKVEERGVLGRAPQLCCDDFKDLLNTFDVSFWSDCTLRFMRHMGIGYHEKQLSYCPFCGAKIVLEEDLKLKVIEEPITRHLYHFEPV